jgi:NAD(P)-dependent dehydrogenase (short-subunit alcohol dehydrogenase family)
MKTVLIIGATRNLGAALAKEYAKQPNTIVYATARYAKPLQYATNVHWIGGVDISQEKAGATLTLHYNNDFPIDIVYFVATASSSLFSNETLDHPDFDREVKMYKTSAIGPVFLVQYLVRANILKRGAKIIFIGNEGGSQALRINGSRGGDYGFHGSQAALNMVAKLLSLDLASKEISVGVVHPGLVIPEDRSTKDYPANSGAVRPEVAAHDLIEFTEKFGKEHNGQFWAPRGAT